jgi:hypothetical protein
MKTGNLKDIDDTEAASFETVCEEWMDVLLNLGPQQNILDLMDNPKRDDNAIDLADGDADTVVPLFTEDSRNTLIGELEGMPIPKICVELYNHLKFYFKTRAPWTKGGISHPGQYLIPIMPATALTTVQANKEAIYSNGGLARLHMDKFGIPHQPFKAEMLEGEMHDISNGIWDPCAIGFFAEWVLPLTDDSDPGDGTTSLTPSYPLHQDGSEGHKLYFPSGGKPDDIPLYSVLPLISTYNATYNPYGGLLTSKWSSTVNDMVMRASKAQSTIFTACNIVTTESWGGALLHQFQAQASAANFTISYTGDYLTQDFDRTYWFAGNAKGYKSITFGTESSWLSMILRKGVDMMF